MFGTEHGTAVTVTPNRWTCGEEPLPVPQSRTFHVATRGSVCSGGHHLSEAGPAESPSVANPMDHDLRESCFCLESSNPRDYNGKFCVVLSMKMDGKMRSFTNLHKTKLQAILKLVFYAGAEADPWI